MSESNFKQNEKNTKNTNPVENNSTPNEPEQKKAAHMTAAAAAMNIEGEAATRRSNAPKKPIKKSRISYERKKGLYGYGFLALWLVGVIYMFLIPLVTSLVYSFSYTELVSDAGRLAELGMKSPGLYTEWNNFEHYRAAFLVDQNFLPNLTESLGSMLPQTALILVFSLFVALLLNQKFKGRTFARAVFFLPVLVATGPVMGIINGDMLSQGVSDASQFSTLFKTDFVDQFMEFMGIYNISADLSTQISEFTSDLFNLIWKAGVQILIFLSALQQIPTSAKEAASMEGATGWEFFWKITFPTISPMILANLIYTVIDTFIDSQNPVMKQVVAQATLWNHGFSAALAWIYFAIVAVALGIIFAIASKFVFYQVD